MPRFARLEKLFSFSCEGGEGGESAQKPGKEKQPEVMTDMKPVKIAPEKTNQQAAEQVSCQGAKREINRR